MENKTQKEKRDIRKRCYQFSLDLIALIDVLPHKKSASVISSQLLRSGTSIGANLIEGTGSSSRLEFKRFYEIALKSANETKYWLELLRDSHLADERKVSLLIIEVTELGKMLAVGVIKLKNK